MGDGEAETTAILGNSKTDWLPLSSDNSIVPGSSFHINGCFLVSQIKLHLRCNPFNSIKFGVRIVAVWPINIFSTGTFIPWLHKLFSLDYTSVSKSHFKIALHYFSCILMHSIWLYSNVFIVDVRPLQKYLTGTFIP